MLRDPDKVDADGENSIFYPDQEKPKKKEPKDIEKAKEYDIKDTISKITALEDNIERIEEIETAKMIAQLVRLKAVYVPDVNEYKYRTEIYANLL